MHNLTLPALAVTLLITHPTLAADAAGDKSQATRMSQCSAEAKQKGLKGDARKEHMSVCLRNPAAQAAARDCNNAADGKGLQGEQRKNFVKDCVRTRPGPSVG